MSADRRRAYRVPCRLDAIMRGEHEEAAARLVNLSLTGCLARIGDDAKWLQNEEQVALDIVLPDEKLAIEATTARLEQEDLVAFTFSPLKRRAEASLLRFIRTIERRMARGDAPFP